MHTRITSRSDNRNLSLPGLVAALVIALSGVTFALPTSGVFSTVAPAEAAASALNDGAIAVHNGSWGYKEWVYSKATTRALAGSSVWEISMLASGVIGVWGVIPATYAWTFKYRAQDAVNTGQCFALVRPVWGSPAFAAKTRWDCR